MKSQPLFRINRKNVPAELRGDLYHDLLAMSWKKTLFYYLFFFVVINSLFATLYWLQPDSLLNSRGDWWDCFFFSVQTFATIGYGTLSPATFFANLLVTIEAVTGLVSIAIMTGLFFAKFSRPFAKLEFSEQMVVTVFEGKPTLMFRVINLRENQIIDTSAHLSWLRDGTTLEGQSFRRFHDLKLIRSRIPMFAMSMNLMHVIDESSPFFGHEKNCSGEILVTLVGTDSTFGQTIHASKLYQAEDILWNRRFRDMVNVLPDGTREVDFSQFNQTI